MSSTMQRSTLEELARWAAIFVLAASLSLVASAQPPAVPPGQPASPAVLPRPAVAASGTMRGREGFGDFGVIGAVAPESIGVQGPVPGIPIMQIPVKADEPVYSLKAVKLTDLSEPAFAIVHGTLTQSGTAINPSFVTLESNTMTKTAEASGPGYYTGIVAVKDGVATLRSSDKDIRLYTNPATPIYRSSAASRDDLKKGVNVFLSRKHNPDGSWGDYDAVYILPEGPLPAVQIDRSSKLGTPAPASSASGSAKTTESTTGQLPANVNPPPSRILVNGGASSGGESPSANGGSPSPAK